MKIGGSGRFFKYLLERLDIVEETVVGVSRSMVRTTWSSGAESITVRASI